MRRGFTVIELLVAVVVLLAVIIATSKVFNTASKVASTGEANADVLQQSSVLEEQMRRDLERICRDGFFAIQCVEVPNGINVAAGGPLLVPDPQLSQADIAAANGDIALARRNFPVRCDQIVFFTAGTEISARWAGPGDLVTSGGGQQARATMVRYSHGVQVPRLTTDVVGVPNPSSPFFPPAITRVVGGAGGGPAALLPWTWVPGVARALEFRSGTGGPTTTPVGGLPPIDPNQPEARQWVLARKTALLADDGGHSVFYPEPREYPIAQRLGPSAAPSIFGDRANNANIPQPAGTIYRGWHWREVRDRNWIVASANLVPSQLLQSGWVDIAASDLDKVRRQIAPTLRLRTPLNVGNLTGYVQSVSLPWSIGFGGSAGAPLGWPTGTGAPPWPLNAQIVGVESEPDIGNFQGPTVAGYTSQRDRIMRGSFGTPASGTIPVVGLLGWPRAEKAVTNTDRRTEMLVSPTLLTNCSSFRVDWTWEPGTGRQTDSAGAVLRAVTGLGFDATDANNVWFMRGYEPFAAAPWPVIEVNPSSSPSDQPWFGLPGPTVDSGNPFPPDPRTGVGLAQLMPLLLHQGVPAEVTNRHMQLVAQTIEGIAVEVPNPAPVVTNPFPGQNRIRVYTAVFGFNQDEAYVVTPDGTVVLRDDFTPWPTQIRVTATIHDPRLVLDRGREVQFVLDVPKRRKD
jgi:prepilin-type N-terminal cleavage/methylation domain-containing protein